MSIFGFRIISLYVVNFNQFEQDLQTQFHSTKFMLFDDAFFYDFLFKFEKFQNAESGVASKLFVICIFGLEIVFAL